MFLTRGKINAYLKITGLYIQSNKYVNKYVNK